MALVGVGPAVGAADGVVLGGADHAAALLLEVAAVDVDILLMEQKTGLKTSAACIFLHKCSMFV